ncbi:unnamed protein product [Arctogadus glacialis]
MLRLFQPQQEEQTQPVAMQDRESFLPGKAGLHADFRGDNGSKGDTPCDGFHKAVCTRCRSMLSKYHKTVYEMGRITAFIRERAARLSDTKASPCITSPMRVTRDAACQTESSGALQTEENRNPSKRTEAFQVKVPEHGVHRIIDELDVVCSKPAKRQRHYDTESYDGSPLRLPLPDDVTDWHANSKSPSSQQADGRAWVKVTVKDEGEEEDIPWVRGRREESEEQEDRKRPVSSAAAGPPCNVSALSETPSPRPQEGGEVAQGYGEEEDDMFQWRSDFGGGGIFVPSPR